MLHFLSPMILQDSPEMRPLVLQAESVARQRHQQFRDAGNLKLAGRYARLCAYFARHPLAPEGEKTE
jgi:hypothetical protein